MVALLESQGIVAILTLIVTTVVGPVVAYSLGKRRETSDIRTQEAARVESVVRALSTVVDQLQEENGRLLEQNRDLWRAAAEQHTRYESVQQQLAAVKGDLLRLQRQAHPEGI